MITPRDGKVERETPLDRELNRDAALDDLRRLVVQLLNKEKETNGDLNEDERKAIRKMLERDERVAWFWSTMRLWGAWIAGTVAFVVLTQEYAEKLVKAVKWIFR